ncbi:hypothetical protein CAEBREN_08620 [Caenorhabditis brenneri]|uniref:Uncharacterized protein n=1 Tax=Caenorhabditis brenneri TaxID=135651 RepID=G0MP15_CAEBE|nr:hypothetical protein CAEBREN_08620 [Caenorhabditis brenneri]
MTVFWSVPLLHFRLLVVIFRVPCLLKTFSALDAAFSAYRHNFRAQAAVNINNEKKEECQMIADKNEA